jgi:hypothetical protein
LLSSRAGADVTLLTAAELLGSSLVDARWVLGALTGLHLLREQARPRSRPPGLLMSGA